MHLIIPFTKHHALHMKGTLCIEKSLNARLPSTSVVTYHPALETTSHALVKLPMATTLAVIAVVVAVLPTTTTAPLPTLAAFTFATLAVPVVIMIVVVVVVPVVIMIVVVVPVVVVVMVRGAETVVRGARGTERLDGTVRECTGLGGRGGNDGDSHHGGEQESTEGVHSA